MRRPSTRDLALASTPTPVVRLRSFVAFALWIAVIDTAQAADPSASSLKRVAALLDYVATDYPPALHDGKVVDPAEIAEEHGFLTDAAATVRPDANAAAPMWLAGSLEQLAGAIQAGRPADEVTATAKRLRGDLIRDAGLTLGPTQVPSRDRGAALYTQGCASCHGEDGAGHSGLSLSTPLPDFTRAQRRAELSPERIFGAIAYGVPGTAMPAYEEAWDEATRWDVAFYLLAMTETVDHAGAAPFQEFAPPLSTLASSTNAQLRDALVEHGFSGAALEGAAARLRTEAPYHPSAQTPLAAARRAVGEAIRSYDPQSPVAARGAVLAAYLDSFEPHEAKLRASEAALVTSIETAFTALRTSMEQRATAVAVQTDGARLEALLTEAERAARVGGASVSFLAALAILLREGLEAALLIAALLALAKKLAGPPAARAVTSGVLVALAFGAILWFVSGLLLARGSGTARELTEGVLQVLTAVLLLAAARWLVSRSSLKRLLDALSARSRMAGGSAWAIGSVAFLCIFRETFEVVIFYRSLLLESPGFASSIAAGAAVGAVLLAVAVFSLQYIGLRLKTQTLMTTSSAVLAVLAVVVTGEAVRSLQEAAVLPLSLALHFTIPALGVYGSREGLLAQGAVLLVMAVAGLAELRQRRLAAG